MSLYVVPNVVWKDFKIPQQSLIAYVRNEQKELVGVVVASKIDGEIQFALSKCRKNDRFVKKFGLQVAFERLAVGTPLPKNLPFGFETEITKLRERAKRYFKIG